jgi:phosphodiesterase/alkaline phosphatase D-like protein
LPLATHHVQFFALDTVRLDSGQLDWLRRELARSTADWKICFYHHPCTPRDGTGRRRSG